MAKKILGYIKLEVPAAFFKRKLAGGVLVTKVNDLSW